MTVALPAPVSWAPPPVPTDAPVVPVRSQAEWVDWLNRVRVEYVHANVSPKAPLTLPPTAGLDSTVRDLRPRGDGGGRRPIAACFDADHPDDLPTIRDTAWNNFAAVIQGDCYVVLDGFRWEGNVWGVGLGYMGGLPTWGKHGIRGLRGRRWVVSSTNQAALMVGGRGVHDVELEDLLIPTAGREGIYIGDGSASTAESMALIDGLTIRRFEVTKWGAGTDGAEAVDWKQGANVVLEDGWCHHGRTFSQGAITAPGPNLHLVLPNKPSGRLSRIAIGHVQVQAGRGAIDGSGIYVSAGDILVEDLTVFDVLGWAVLRGRNAPLAQGESVVRRMQYAGCASGRYNENGGPNSGGYERGVYPTLTFVSEATERTDLIGDPRTWTLADFGTVTPPPPPPPVEPPPTEPPGDLAELTERVGLLELSVTRLVRTASDHGSRIADLEDTRASIHAVTAPEEG